MQRLKRNFHINSNISESVNMKITSKVTKLNLCDTRDTILINWFNVVNWQLAIVNQICCQLAIANCHQINQICCAPPKLLLLWDEFKTPAIVKVASIRLSSVCSKTSSRNFMKNKCLLLKTVSFWHLRGSMD